MKDLKRKSGKIVDKMVQNKKAKVSPEQEDRVVEGKLPVTTLCGFLGAGKTTLLQHILETKHNGDEPFRCAVIVNDMAELNIDKSLIDKSALVQSDEVISMQNGCVCCTLQSDMVDQISKLAEMKKFDYMIVEASGVSEPAEIASVFAKCEDDHDGMDHEEAHKEKTPISELARLDTCATVIDSADFFLNFETSKIAKRDEFQTLSQLMVEQIEYANIIILNKADLVTKEQMQKIQEHVAALNPKAKIITSQNSKIDVMNVVDTKMYEEGAFDFSNSPQEKLKKGDEVKSCCKEKIALGEIPCCKSKRTIKSDKSKIILGTRQNQETRHSSRFGVTSFLYHARRPFHPQRFHENFVEQFFVFVEREESKNKEEDPQVVEERQALAAEKQKIRNDEFGVLCRSKGFVWMANTHDLMGCYGQAGNMVTIETPGPWACLDPRAYVNDDEKLRVEFRKDFEAPWGDRRQELVFIGIDLKHKAIQNALDAALLTDEEFALGLDGWKATIGDLFLDGDDGESEGEEGEEEEMEEAER
eukprot:Pgem_evm1s5661